MRKIYRNELHRIIQQELGYDPALFTLKEIAGGDTPTIEISVRDTPLRFIIRNASNSWDLFDYRTTRYRPDWALTNWYPTNAHLNFDQMKEHFVKWMREHPRRYFEDQESTDSWRDWDLNRTVFDAIDTSSSDNSDFNMEQAAAIERTLNDFRVEVIEKLGLQETEIHKLNESIDYLIEASSRVGRKDWIMLAVSSVLGIAVTLSLDTTRGRVLFELFRATLSALGFGTPLIGH
jgi:hypothetical protein